MRPGPAEEVLSFGPRPKQGRCRAQLSQYRRPKGGLNLQYEHLRRPSAKSRPVHCFSLRPRGTAEKQPYL